MDYGMLRFREILGMSLRGEVMVRNTLELAMEIIRMRKEKFVDQSTGLYGRTQIPMYDTRQKIYNVFYYADPNGTKTIVYITPDNSELREIVEYFGFYQVNGYYNMLVDGKTPEDAISNAISSLSSSRH